MSTTSPSRFRPRSRKRRSPRFPRLLALVLVFALGFAAGRMTSGTVSNPKGRQTPAQAHKEPPVLPDWVTEDLIPTNEYSRPGIALDSVSGIVIHYVGNPGTTAQNNRDYFAGLADTHETHASAHFVIGMEGEILQCVPLNELAYCSNNRNHDTLSIECCHPGEDGQFTQETYDGLVKLTSFLADYYGLQEDQVIRHYDVTGKLCPLFFVEHEDAWDAFQQDVFR